VIARNLVVVALGNRASRQQFLGTLEVLGQSLKAGLALRRMWRRRQLGLRFGSARDLGRRW
jgi:hypothetical protein